MTRYAALIRQRHWEDPSVTQLNRLPAHCPLASYPSVEAALDDADNAIPVSRNRIFLNGLWKFALYQKPEEVPSEVVCKEFNDDSWQNIAVPSNWQLQDTDDNLSTPISSTPLNRHRPRCLHTIRLGIPDDFQYF